MATKAPKTSQTSAFIITFKTKEILVRNIATNNNAKKKVKILQQQKRRAVKQIKNFKSMITQLNKKTLLSQNAIH